MTVSAFPSQKIQRETLYEVYSNIPRTKKPMEQTIDYYRHEETARAITTFLSDIYPEPFVIGLRKVIKNVDHCPSGITQLKDTRKGSLQQIVEKLPLNRNDYLKLLFLSLKYKKIRKSKPKAQLEQPKIMSSSIFKISPVYPFPDGLSLWPSRERPNSSDTETSEDAEALFTPTLSSSSSSSIESSSQKPRNYQLFYVCNEKETGLANFKYEYTALKAAKFLKKIIPEFFELKIVEKTTLPKLEGRSICTKTNLDREEYGHLLNLTFTYYLTPSERKSKKQKPESEILSPHKKEELIYPNNKDSYTYSYYKKNRDLLAYAACRKTMGIGPSLLEQGLNQ